MRHAHLVALKRHAREVFPEECCGVLLGREANGVRDVGDVKPARNARRDSARNRYMIAPEELLCIDRDARERGLDVIGYYHSHPDAPARPSRHDRDHAWPWVSYVIVEVRAGAPGKVTSWVFDGPDAPFEEEPIEILEGNDP